MKEKKKYLTPKLKVDIIELEESIAAGSATLKPGGPTLNERPAIADWQDTGIQDSFDWNL
ncbi:hypothetical protein [Sphingobacterium sp. UDSM-2020]|uniref:hypothetical protein n=1 Tax=Sphingobacterium sp. UDSM-2020 TaxID=2795738 RepID=UPI0019353569|nr:hypothetical protein [Sphingobacterium sp. UDSM-2020]QQD16182.1 hypothetical protein JAZ75_11950 [Sphingobacterium sp. UDSM-2020]